MLHLFSPDNRTLLELGPPDRGILFRVADPPRGPAAPGWTYRLPAGMRQATFSPDGSLLATVGRPPGALGDRVEVWRCAEGVRLGGLEVAGARIGPLAVDGSGRTLAIAMQEDDRGPWTRVRL